MKKTVFIVAIVSMLLVALMVGCRAVEKVPGVSAVQSVMPTLPGVSPSPAYTMTTAGPTVTAPASNGSLGANSIR